MPRKAAKLRPDVAETAVRVFQEAIGEAPKAPSPSERTEKNREAVRRGASGGKRAGQARAHSLSRARRSKIARKAAHTRWRRGRRNPGSLGWTHHRPPLLFGEHHFNGSGSTADGKLRFRSPDIRDEWWVVLLTKPDDAWHRRYEVSLQLVVLLPNQEKQREAAAHRGIALQSYTPDLLVVRQCDPPALSNVRQPDFIRRSRAEMVVVAFDCVPCCAQRVRDAFP